MISAGIHGIGIEKFGLWLLHGRLHLFTLSKVRSVMSGCGNVEAVHRWVVVDDITRENIPRSFRTGHAPRVLELLNLMISAGFFNYFQSDPLIAFANLLQQILYPTNMRHTQLYIHVAVEHVHQLRVISTNPSVNLLLRVPAQVSLLSHILLLDSASGTICSARF